MGHNVAFITGSAKRLGAATARKLHQNGFNLVLHCNHSVEQAQQLMTDLNSVRAGSAQLIQGDLSQPEQVENLAHQAIAAFGQLNVLVNNASAFYPTPIGDVSQQSWHELMASNAQAPLFLSQACAGALRIHQGAIINMVDIHAERPLKNHTVYSMAKAALVAMTRSLAQELAPHVRVNGIAPGAILWPESPLGEQEKEGVLKQIPLERIGQPDDIANAIAFLIDAPYITGQILAVDGGRSIAIHTMA